MQYKIYYNDSFVLLADEHPQIKEIFTKTISGNKDAEAFFSNSLQLFDGVTNENILVVCNSPADVFAHFLQQVKLIIAGGGMVTNEHGELLLIYRRGKWDLPKGKIDKGENILDGAIREVEEETGVKVETTNIEPILTYHAYKLKGENCLKETSWFEMLAKPGQSKLTPQAEEDIEQVLWVKKTDLKNYKSECYPLILDLISGYSDAPDSSS